MEKKKDSGKTDETTSHAEMSPLRKRRLRMIARRRFLLKSAKLAAAAAVVYSAPKISGAQAARTELSPETITTAEAFESVSSLGHFGVQIGNAALLNLPGLTPEQIANVEDVIDKCQQLSDDAKAVIDSYKALSPPDRATVDNAIGHTNLTVIVNNNNIINNGNQINNGIIQNANGENTTTQITDGGANTINAAIKGGTNPPANSLTQVGQAMATAGGAIAVAGAAAAGTIVGAPVGAAIAVVGAAISVAGAAVVAVDNC